MFHLLLTGIGLVMLESAETESQRVIAGAIFGVGLNGAVTSMRENS